MNSDYQTPHPDPHIMNYIIKSGLNTYNGTNTKQNKDSELHVTTTAATANRAGRDLDRLLWPILCHKFISPKCSLASIPGHI